MNEYCIINGELKALYDFNNNHIISGHSIYEVLRIYNGKPAFFDEHLNRLIRSAALTGIQTPDAKSIYDGICLLLKKSGKQIGNIEITVNNQENWFIKFLPHFYPTESQYKEGIKCRFYNALRENPNAKVKRLKLRADVGEYIKKNNLYEAIYEQNGIISEGSRSNIFFIRNNQFFTPPKELVLPGITRQIVINILKESNLVVNEINILLKEISDFQAAFITGTSPGVLPILYLEDQKFDVQNHYLRLLMEKYNDKLAQ